MAFVGDGGLSFNWTKLPVFSPPSDLHQVTTSAVLGGQTLANVGASSSEYLARCQGDGIHIRYDYSRVKVGAMQFEIYSQYHVLPPSPITVTLLGSQDIKQGASARQIEHNLHLIYRYLLRHKVRQLIAVTPLAALTLDPASLLIPANFTPAQESVRQAVRQWILHQPGITVIDADRDGVSRLRDVVVAGRPDQSFSESRRLSKIVSDAIKRAGKAIANER